MSKHDLGISDDTPFETTELDERRVLVVLAVHVDHRRTRPLGAKLEEAIRKHQRVAIDASQSETIDSDWLTLFHELTIEAEQAGKRLLICGLSPALQKSADVIGLTHLKLVKIVQEAWK